MRSLLYQVAGNHYRNFPIQPAEFIARNKIPFAEGCIIKRMCRHRTKGGIEDLRKARQELEIIAEVTYGEKL